MKFRTVVQSSILSMLIASHPTIHAAPINASPNFPAKVPNPLSSAGVLGTIVKLYVFSESPNGPGYSDGGDILVAMSGVISACDGYFLNPSMTGWKQTYSVLLTAVATKSNVILNYDSTPGRTWLYNPRYCRLDTAILVP
jgi:hypothetical protein